MNFVDCNYNEFVERTLNCRIIGFGAVSDIWDYELYYPDIINRLFNKLEYIVDNNIEKQEKYIKYSGINIKIKDPVVLCKDDNFVLVLLLPLRYHKEVCTQLKSMIVERDVQVYSLRLMQSNNTSTDDDYAERFLENKTEYKIPKLIHSFWFSGEEKPPIYQKCIESWHRLCDDFEIIEWNTNNYDVKKNPYMYEAFKQKKWAFVSDYARLDVVFHFGGIYLDMDVELIKRFDDFRKADSFFCRQENCTLDLGSGFGAKNKHKLVKKLLDAYNDRNAYNEDGSFSSIDQPSFLFPVFSEYGVENKKNTQIIANDVFLNQNYFVIGGKEDHIVRDDTIAIHWHNGGWLSQEDKDRQIEKEQMEKELRSIFFRKW